MARAGIVRVGGRRGTGPPAHPSGSGRAKVHHAHAEGDTGRAGVAVITVSDTRTQADDASGAAICSLAEGAGHGIRETAIVPDDGRRIRRMVERLAARDDVQAIILTGGTGISPRDVTREALDGLLEKELEGFGELFRMLSFEQVGPAAMLSRAVAGVVANTVVFALPGSERGVRLAMERLILPQLGHLVSELGRGAAGARAGGTA